MPRHEVRRADETAECRGSSDCRQPSSPPTHLAVTGERVLRRKDDGRSFEEGLVMVDLIMENAGSETDL